MMVTASQKLIPHVWIVDEDGSFVEDAYFVDPTIDVGFRYTTDPLASGFIQPVYTFPPDSPDAGLVTGGEWVDLSPVEPPSELENHRHNARIRIDQERTQREQAGVPYQFGDVLDTIQTRYEKDLINISGRAQQALLLQTRNVTDPVMSFRAESNTTYQLTPAQMTELATTVADFVSALYETAWQLKDAIDAAENMDAIDAITWPEG